MSAYDDILDQGIIRLIAKLIGQSGKLGIKICWLT